MTEPIADLHPALAAAARGWYVFPIKPRGKEPLTAHGFKDATTDPKQIQAWIEQFPDCNWGLDTGRSGLLVGDVDPKNGGDVSWAELVAKHPELANTVRVQTQGDGLHLYWLRPPANGHGDLGNTVSHIAPGIDTRGAGGYVVIPPSIGPSGKPYRWATGHAPHEVAVAALPKVLFEMLQRPKDRPVHAVAVPEVIADGKRNDTLFRMAAGLQRKGYSAQAMLACLKEENRARCRPPLPDREVETIVRQASRYDAGPIPDVLIDAALTQVGNGERLVALFGHRFCHVHEWGWLVWDGRCWERDTRGHMEALAKKTVVAILQAADRISDEETRKALRKWAKSSQSMKNLREMIAAARSEPGIDRHMDEFDTHDGLLNVRNGVVDLATGELAPHNPDLYFTTYSNVDYDPNALAPRWDQLVRDLSEGSPDPAERIGYMQRCAGYTLTGYVREQKLFFLYGNGSNGKTTFVEILAKLLGKLATPMGFDTFLNSRDNRFQNDMASLVGRRMTMATEAPEGRSFNEEALKSATGGDSLRAKLLYKDSFDMTVRFKLWLTGNNRPTIRGITLGTWRRFELVPCLRSVPEHKRVKDLKEKLLQELPGILAWCVRGAIAWHTLGLQTPADIRQAVEDYRKENDVVGRWIEEACTLGLGKEYEMPAGQGLHAINDWLKKGHEPEMTAAMFGRRLASWAEANGAVVKHKDGDGRIVWQGIRLGKYAPVADAQSNLDAMAVDPRLNEQGDKMRQLFALVKQICAEKDNDKGIATGARLEAELATQGWTANEVRDRLRHLLNQGVLYSKMGADTYAPLRGGP